MNNMNKLKFATIAASMFILGLLFSYEKEVQEKCELCLNRETVSMEDPPCLQMYFSIEKFAEQYNIPKRFAYGIAFAETRYEGPFDWDYQHTQTSFAGAIGPMQIMPSTAKMMWPGSSITNKKLMNDIQFNVETSMKLLRRLYDKYGNWKTVFGCYNTGRPCVNGYAERVYAHQPNW
jgi:hypothetical protein